MDTENETPVETYIANRRQVELALLRKYYAHTNIHPDKDKAKSVEDDLEEFYAAEQF